MSRFVDELQSKLGFTKSNPEYETILKAYRLGYVAGQYEMFTACNLPHKFRLWLDQNFTRGDAWLRSEPLESDPPEVLPYSSGKSFYLFKRWCVIFVFSLRQTEPQRVRPARSNSFRDACTDPPPPYRSTSPPVYSPTTSPDYDDPHNSQ